MTPPPPSDDDIGPWRRPGAPRAATTGTCTVQVVPDALVSGFSRRRLATLDPPGWGMCGAVYDTDGLLVPGSRRTWSRHNPTVPIAVDAPTYAATARGETTRLSGRWIYAGHWTRHFGHFLVETLPNLWPDPATSDGPVLAGIVAHRSFRGPVGDRPSGTTRVPDWQRALLELSGHAGLQVFTVRGDAVTVEELVVPSRPVVFRAFVHPEALALWQRVGAAGAATTEGPTPPRIFWSRTRFNRDQREADHDRTSAVWDEHLDQTFAAAGFTVVSPETIPVPRQVALAQGAEVMAGSSGSALHLSAVARPTCLVLEVGDGRNPHDPQSSQTMIDAALGRRTTFVDHQDTEGLARVLDHL